jgi:hypothetical protein
MRSLRFNLGRPGARLASLAWLASVAGVLASLWPAPVQAQPRRLALVIGNSTYPAWPALDACRTAVNGMSASLRRAGFEVTERVNPSNGQMGSAISDFADAVGRGGDTVAVAYVCGYAVALDSRVFLMPASANLTRDTDALSQGILSRQFVNAMTRPGARSGLILLDLVALPGSAGTLPLPGLIDPATLGGKGFAVVQTLGALPAGTTELAATASAAITPGATDWKAVTQSLRSKLPSSARRAVLVHDPVDAGPANTNASTAATPAPAATALGAADMRRVQLALQRLGYYGGKVDGVVGPDTLAAVRRYQHELRSEMTGQLSAEQAARLLKDSQ